jgi:hypothetical protein
MTGAAKGAIGVVHLVWGPLGAEPLLRFLDSYRAHAAGAEHELVVVFNGVGEPAPLQAELACTPHRLLTLERPVLDLAAYGLAARELSHERLCFLNSYSTILADGWLRRLAGALEQPRVAIAGATGSWESQAEWVRGRLLYWPYQLLRLHGARRDYPRFPNPHVRTTGFLMRRADILACELEQAHDKRSAYLLESGRRSVTGRLLDRGARALLVGRDGRCYDVEEWPQSATYRSGGQRNLLIADNRTADWERASPRLRRRLSRDAWGERCAAGEAP